MVKVAVFVYKLLYIVLNHLYTVLEVVLSWQSKLFSHEFKQITRPKKLPKHLTVLLGHEEPSLNDLTNLILWSMTAGISFISFYDYKGTLKKEEDRFRSVVAKQKQAEDHVIWHDSTQTTPGNGFQGNKIRVKIMDGQDGRPTVVALCKQLSIDSEMTDFSVQNIDRVFSKQFQFPDPDLAVCCGKTFSLFGYPPWQIRVTELLSLSSHHNVRLDVFLRILERFSKCEQRVGK